MNVLDPIRAMSFVSKRFYSEDTTPRGPTPRRGSWGWTPNIGPPPLRGEGDLGVKIMFIN